jgi:hypothetical protein
MSERLFGPVTQFDDDEFMETGGFFKWSGFKKQKYTDQLRILKAEQLAAQFEVEVFTTIVPTKARRKEALERLSKADKAYRNHIAKWKSKEKTKDLAAFQEQMKTQFQATFAGLM